MYVACTCHACYQHDLSWCAGLVLLQSPHVYTDCRDSESAQSKLATRLGTSCAVFPGGGFLEFPLGGAGKSCVDDDRPAGIGGRTAVPSNAAPPPGNQSQRATPTVPSPLG